MRQPRRPCEHSPTASWDDPMCTCFIYESPLDRLIASSDDVPGLVAEVRDLRERLAQAYRDEITWREAYQAQVHVAHVADTKVAAVEALAAKWDEKAVVLARQSESRAGLSDAAALAAAAEFYAARAANLRAALAAPTDTTKEN